MNYVRGERFEVNLDSDEEEAYGVQREEATAAAAPPSLFSFISDVKERTVGEAKPPSAPTPKSTTTTTTTTGFPAHKKRTRVSAFKQRRANQTDRPAGSTAPAVQAPRSAEAKLATPKSLDEDEWARIDQENTRRLAEMSPEEIEQEREELLAGLNPSLIQKLLSRANIDDGSNERDLFPDIPKSTKGGKEKDDRDTNNAEAKRDRLKKTVTFEKPPALPSQPEPSTSTTTTSTTDSQPAPGTTTIPKPSITPTVANAEPDTPINPNATIDPAAAIDPSTLSDLPTSIHFPHPPQPPQLDPDDPNFLQNLHDKYFPTLPYDPSSLEWMTPVPAEGDPRSPYHPSQQALAPAALRFDFRGQLLPPSRAVALPTHLGLHHHADAPEAAGYTVPELATLARSAVPAQRCLAFQTLGRILYRLGRGKFGVEAGQENYEGPGDGEVDGDGEEVAEGREGWSALCAGLWELVERERVLEILAVEAGRDKGHLTARTMAQEALWNWRRGGGRRRKAV